jgi:hypothetical protein
MKTNLYFWVAFAGLLSFASCLKREIPIPPPVHTDSVTTPNNNDTDQTFILRPDSTTGQDAYVSKLDGTTYNDGAST